MQYKTIQISHGQFTKKKQDGLICETYEKEINEMAAQGWKLLGIHNVSVNRDAGCISAMFGTSTHFISVDVLVFFKE